MARSLVIKHEESSTFSPLFVGAVLLAITTLMLSAATGWSDPAEAAAGAERPTAVTGLQAGR